MAAEQDKIIKDAQYRKGLSIAFFNATNSALEMVKLEADQLWKESLHMATLETTTAKKRTKGEKLPKTTKVKAGKKKPPSFQERFVFWREWLLEEHKTYYANVIAQIGTNYEPKESIKKLEDAKSLEELQNTWRLLSADERHDGDIIKVAQALRDGFLKQDDTTR